MEYRGKIQFSNFVLIECALKLTALMIPCFIKLFTSRFMVKLSKLPIVDTTMPGLFTFHFFLSSLNTSFCGVSSDNRMYLKISSSILQTCK